MPAVFPGNFIRFGFLFDHRGLAAVLGWTATVFFGFGTRNLVFVCIIGGIIFVGVYHNLPKLRFFGAKAGARPVSAAFVERAKPPASKTQQLIPGSVG